MPIDPEFVVGTATAWLWGNYGKEIIDNTVGTLRAQWEKVNWLRASNVYRQRVKEMYSTMRLLYKSETVPLDDYYVDLYMLDEKTADKWYRLEDLQSSFDAAMSFARSDKRESAWSIINYYDFLFVYGNPGSGKTTLLKYYATLAADNELNKIPIFIPLSEWAYSKNGIEDFIAKEFEICGFPNAHTFIKYILKKGKALVLFDGLDEVSEETGERIRIIRETDNFIKQYHRNKICITCRIPASNYVFEGKEKIKYFQIADFTSHQVVKFTQKWFTQDPKKGERFLAQLSAEEHGNLRELSQNPLLLGLLCLVFDNSSTFPTNRAQIYRDAIDGLLELWDGQQGVRRDKIAPDFTPTRERDLLSLLGFHYFQKGEIFFDKEDLSKNIVKFIKQLSNNKQEFDGSKIARSIDEQHGLLTQRSLHFYSFSHLTFHEYFAARYVVEHNSKKNLEIVLTHIKNYRWREVFVLIASLLPNADIFFEIFQKAVRDIIKKDQTLITVLKWANQIALEDKDVESAQNARMILIDKIIKVEQFLKMVRSLITEHDYNIGDSFARALNIDLDVDINQGDAVELAKIVVLRKNFADQIPKKLIKFLKLSHKRSVAFDNNEEERRLFIDYSQAIIQLRENLSLASRQLEDELMEKIQDVAYEYLPEEIREIAAKLDTPRFNPKLQEWKGFVSSLYAKSFKLQIQGKLLELSDVHILQIKEYLRANLLLLECLDVSKVSNQSTIRNSLFTL